MTTIQVTPEDGETQTIDATNGISLMQNLKDHGFEDILALCGGACACATCHIHVRSSGHPEAKAQGSKEIELLEDSEFYEENSRLSCQITVSAELEGIEIYIPPAE